MMVYKNRYYDSSKAHHTTRGFQNTEPFKINYKDIKRWKKERQVKAPKNGYHAFSEKWYQKADFSANYDGVWWLGHSTSLIKINNKIILTDPIFSKRASPVQFLGPKRHTPCACSIDELPKIDIIVISHNHYDHMDYCSIRRLIKRFPAVVIVVPLGLKAKIRRWGAKNIIELDWWNNIDIDGVLLSCIPSRHWSRRGLFDTNRTLWCGWMIQYQKRTVYFIGDTAYSTEFKQVKTRFPNIDMALIPIGSYAPRWFMQNQHIDPQQAVQLFHDLGCKRALAIHWGAFELADESLSDPPEALKLTLYQNNITTGAFITMKIGGYTII